MVHIAPSHGSEDHAACVQAGIELKAGLVGLDGCYTSLAGSDLAGLEVT